MLSVSFCSLIKKWPASYDDKVRPLPQIAWANRPSLLADAILFF